nr:hypothetical protein I302_02919 [Kwoniella bestiolae CBS 10118]OCF28068.1 hypothetical protein I302_02919 [Kwoniella bestiolae CBS 10118]
MAPSKPSSNANPPPPSSRRSARIAEQPKSAAAAANGNGEKKETKVTSKKEVNSKKRSVENGESTDPKKAKTSEPKSKTTTSKKEDAKKDSESSKSKKEEKEAEAPASAKPDTGSKGALKLGDKLPKITLKDNEGNDVDVSSLTGDKGVVVFLYPRADTPGCTTQACGYRDINDQIKEFGYDIYGLSKDKSEAQQKWINKKQLTYKLLCDPESKLIKR